MKTENAYLEVFENRLNSDSTEVFGNFSLENSRYIVPRLIASAKESVVMLINRIDDYPILQFFDSVHAAADNIVANLPNNAKSAIRIITTGGRAQGELQMLAEEVNYKHKLGVVSYIETQYNGRKPLQQYVVVDHKRYRLEEARKTSKMNPESDVLKSEVCCNGPVKAGLIECSFNRLWNKLLDSTKTK